MEDLGMMQILRSDWFPGDKKRQEVEVARSVKGYMKWHSAGPTELFIRGYRAWYNIGLKLV